MPRVVGISGNITRPSRTHTLVDLIVQAVAETDGWTSQSYDMIDVAPRLATSLSREDADASHAKAWDAVVEADALVVGSPVYKASYTGMLKHFFDLIDPKALFRKPVILCATARTPLHGLVIDHQLRPLFAFFRAWVMPTGIFALDSDLSPDGSASDDLKANIARAVEELLTLSRSR